MPVPCEPPDRGPAPDAALSPLLRHMPAVVGARETLQSLQGVWDSLAMLSELSGTGVEINGVRAAFGALTATLVEALGSQSHAKAARTQRARAQVTIDILVRNLFERTADIGFLAMDDDLRRFARAGAAEREAGSTGLRVRLGEYQRKYSVYDDIVLLAPDGQVLARLTDGAGPAQSRERALLDDALNAGAPYVEAFGALDLWPQAPRSLVYACRVTDGEGAEPLGVLCLRFRLDDECERIFATYLEPEDWTVVVLLRPDGEVIASSDPFQVPPGARLPHRVDGAARLARFGGREWLAVACAAQPFQGYAGPGWHTQAMTPVEHAFALDRDVRPVDDAASLQSSRVLFPEAMRTIAQSAQRIEVDLSRAVWNGNIAQIAGAAATGATHNAGFSRSLLHEIGRTGARTREVFTQSLAAMGGAVASTVLVDAAARARLAVDVMDRSLYERANDCRWWAQTTSFRRGLESAADDTRATLGAVLRAIHALYTVYANLLLFDREGRVVAASRPEGMATPGTRLQAEWVARTLALPGPQAYCASAFEASPLYGDGVTQVYTAAVRGLADPSRVVGGVAIVFDGQPQFGAMLADSLPRDDGGAAHAGAFGIFVDADGRVLIGSEGAPAAGSVVELAADLRRGGAGTAAILAWQGRWYSVGFAGSRGYREFKGEADPYREDIAALVFDPLTDRQESDATHPVDAPPPMPRGVAATGAGSGRIDLATLRIGSQWHAMVGCDLVEAIGADHLLPLPGRPDHIRGSVMFRGAPIAVLDARHLLGERRPAGPPGASGRRQVVVVRTLAGTGRTFGLLVDALGDNPQVAPGQLVRLGAGAARSASGALIDTVVAAAPGATDRELLTLLSTDALAALV